MVESSENTIDLTFLDSLEKQSFTVLIILNRPIIKELYYKLKDKIDFIICADGAANRVYDDFKDDKNLPRPNCIVGDFDSIRPEVQEFYASIGVRLYKREDTDTTDLEKCLYVSLEKISDFNSSDVEQALKKYSIILLGSCGGRMDHTFSSYSQVYKYLQNYSYQFNDIEIILLSNSSCSVYLKPGLNRILTSSTWEKKNDGYSIIAINGECNIEVIEDDNIKTFLSEKYLKFGHPFFYRRNHNAKTISINLKCDSSNVAVIYSFTTIFHA